MKIRFLSREEIMPFAFALVGVVSMLLAFSLASMVVKRSKAQTPTPEVSTQNQVAEPVPAPLPESVDTGAAFLEPYLYDIREGRRNPFKPPPDIELPASMSPGGPGNLSGPTSPLERYEIDELKIVAIMWDVRKPRVLIIDPNKDVHTAYKDERIGRRRGYIAVIRESEVVVVEPTSFSGETVYSTRILRITE